MVENILQPAHMCASGSARQRFQSVKKLKELNSDILPPTPGFCILPVDSTTLFGTDFKQLLPLLSAANHALSQGTSVDMLDLLRRDLSFLAQITAPQAGKHISTQESIELKTSQTRNKLNNRQPGAVLWFVY